MKLKFHLWNLYYNESLNIDEYIPKDGNATLNIQNKLNENLITYLGFVSQNDLLIRLDIFNEFEKQLFKRENRGPFSLPMDLSNLLGIKKDKLISILKSRSFNIQDIAENDLVISKKIKANKTMELKQNNSKRNIEITERWIRIPYKNEESFKEIISAAASAKCQLYEMERIAMTMDNIYLEVVN